MRDLHLAVRHLLKDRAFGLTAGLTLAVCIGANVALFTVVDHVLLRPLPVPDADAIVLVYNSYPKAGAERAGATAPDYFDRLRELTVFESQAMFTDNDPALGLPGAPERIQTFRVTPSFFAVAGVAPRLGRAFTDEEGELGRNRVVVLSDALWRRLYPVRPASDAGTRSADGLGQTVRLDGVPHTVVGVMPPDFRFIEPDVQAWVALAFTDEQKAARYSNNWGFIGRLKSGATVTQAQAQVDALNAANLERFPESQQVLPAAGFHTVAVRLQDDLVREVRPTLYLLWGGALFVLLLGAVNVASLVLVRSRVRLKELATRMALGAGRLRLARQLAIEHVLLALASSVGGLGIGYGALELFRTLGSDQLPGAVSIRVDAVIVAYTLAAAALIGIVIGAIPVAALVPVRLADALHEGGRSGTAGRGFRALRRSLIVGQLAVAFVLLIGAGLLLASFQRVLTIDPGFEPDGVLTASLGLPVARYADGAAVTRFGDELLRSVRSLPGVVSAGLTSSIPLGQSFSQDVIFPEGHTLPPGASLIAPHHLRVTPGYFEAMKVRLVSGRFFDDRDTADAPRMVIVDEPLARLYWPGVDPIGKRMYEPSSEKDLLAMTKDTEWYTVVGVVGEVKLRGLVEGVGGTGAYYMLQAQQFSRGLTLAVRTEVEPSAMVTALRREILRLDGELPIFDVWTMSERVVRSVRTRRASMWLAVAFGIVALLLSAVGLFGVLAYLVAQRTKEIGIRIALGSSKAAVMRLVLRESLLLVGSGLALGAGGAVLLTRSLESQLFGVRATDPMVVLLAAAVLSLVALVACALPVRRATEIDPLLALAE